MRSLLADPTVLNYHLRVNIFHSLIREKVITPMKPLEGMKPIKKGEITPSFCLGGRLSAIWYGSRQVSSGGWTLSKQLEELQYGNRDRLQNCVKPAVSTTKPCPLSGCSRGPVRCGLGTGSQGCDKQSLLSPNYITIVIIASKLLHLPDLNPKK